MYHVIHELLNLILYLYFFQLRDCELSPVVNRELSNRVRSVSGITSHKGVVRSDLKLAARLVQQLDDKNNLWKGDTELPKKKIEKEDKEDKDKDKDDKEKEKDKPKEKDVEEEEQPPKVRSI